MTIQPLRLAIAQSAVSADVQENGRHMRSLMDRAAAAGARLVHFPEAALSGYVKSHIKAWEDVDWAAVEDEIEATARHSARLGIWTVLGCNYRLAAPKRPQNSLYVISDQGVIAARYSKRFCSNSEVTSWYTPGADPVVFEVDGVRFGCAVCIEVCFPELFAEYERLGVHCVLLSSMSEDPIHGLMARAHAATNCYWLSLSTTSACSTGLQSVLVGPDGIDIAVGPPGAAQLVFGDLNPDDPRYEIALRRARPWRARARSEEIYEGRVA